jgi:hypothetical protein
MMQRIEVAQLSDLTGATADPGQCYNHRRAAKGSLMRFVGDRVAADDLREAGAVVWNGQLKRLKALSRDTLR